MAEAIPHRPLGKTGLMVPPIVFGTSCLGNLYEAVPEATKKAIVGWVELCSAKVQAQLEELSANKRLRAVRHVVQSEPDDNFILRADFNRGVALLRRFKLAYDILIFERQLAAATALVDRHPDQVFVLDHIAKPRIETHEMSPWRERMRELALRPNVYCKVSGMVTEASYTSWTEQQLRPYFDVVLEAFGPQRIMFGSDWPVCLVACDYARWRGLVAAWTAALSQSEQARIFGGTAVEAYGL
jgi:L-fuconolactonase